MPIEKNTIALIWYQVTDQADGKILQQLRPEQAEEFLFGHGLLLDAFEHQLMGKTPGEAFSFEVPCREAYGEIDPRAIFDLPLTTFADENGIIDDEIVQVGHVFPMADNDGNRHLGKIIRKMSDRVTMDFNHTMAGKNLVFSGEVVTVRPATNDEIIALAGNQAADFTVSQGQENKSIFEV